jgi:hypothetical protein
VDCVKLTIIATDPVEEIAAEPATLDQLTASLRATLTERFGQPVTTGEIGAVRGFPLVTDQALLPGVVHLRPASRRKTSPREPTSAQPKAAR